MSAPRWGSLNDLVAVSGFARRTLQYIAKQEPGVLPSRAGKAGRLEYDLGACNTNLRKRERDEAERKAKPVDEGPESLAGAEKRKAIAEASLAELKLAQLEKSVVPLGDHLRELDDLLLHIRARMIAHPQLRDHAPKLLADLRTEPPPALEEEPAPAVTSAA